MSLLLIIASFIIRYYNNLQNKKETGAYLVKYQIYIIVKSPLVNDGDMKIYYFDA